MVLEIVWTFKLLKIFPVVCLLSINIVNFKENCWFNAPKMGTFKTLPITFAVYPRKIFFFFSSVVTSTAIKLCSEK